MLLATIITVCAYSAVTDDSQCNEYIADSAYQVKAADKNTKRIQSEFTATIDNEPKLLAFLKKYGVVETLDVIDSIDITEQPITDGEIP
ncbi:hypothetical protein QGX11_gp112 [Pseudomonas phage PPSC2]|uniref:Uncharacterized protein n=1 Tax=Pseudomonas phage PPSC2 TaxID=2041350 RepID=A0A2R2YAT2_9CAUD|nr:hypothetical protein QGX11_gp112 [Pseudomonas phage PPSC2]ATN92875.1 hypothetical protein PPSC2_112 [Pseudomonas phage PPSC2]